MTSKIVLFISSVLLFAACNRTQNTSEPPNILMISIDDLNSFLGCMGYNTSFTPNIDKLAGEGVLFTNAHAQAPLCGPSRASIMTGLRPSTSGIYGQINDDSIRYASAATKNISFLPDYLGTHGYHTMGIGKIFHQHAPEGILDESGGRIKGFGPKPHGDAFFKWDKKGTSTDWGAFPEHDEQMPDYISAQWAIERIQRDYDKPFFMAVGFVRPHVPWYVPQKWFDKYDTTDIVTPPYLADDFNDIPEIATLIDDLPAYPTTEWAIANDEWKNIIHAYLACISFVDHYVGEILNALENSPHAENTIVLLWSDHGYRMGEKGTFAKHCLWDEATRVPMIIKGPGINQGKKVDTPVELLSIYPTLLELCGLPENKANEGVSIVSQLGNRTRTDKAYAITTYGMNNHAIVDHHYRFIQYEDGSEELYDRLVDPEEWNNLAGLDQYGEVLEAFRKKLPLVNNPWSVYSGYAVNEYFRRTSNSQ